MAELSRLDKLRETEQLLRVTLAGADAPNVAALAKELRATMAEIAALEAERPPEVSLADSLAAKRAAKLAAVNSASSERRGQQRRRGGEHRTS